MGRLATVGDDVPRTKRRKKRCRCSVGAGHFLLAPDSIFVHRSRTYGATAMTKASAVSRVYAPSRLVIVWAREALLGPRKCFLVEMTDCKKRRELLYSSM